MKRDSKSAVRSPRDPKHSTRGDAALIFEDALSDIERQVFELLGEGLSARKTAESHHSPGEH